MDGLIADIRRGTSRALVLHGEAGIGKSALLEYLTESASDLTVIHATGVESEMELAYSGLHQLCGSMLDRLDRLPAPQRLALEIAFGMSEGAAPDRFLVGLAALSLLSNTAEERPVLSVLDDAQWLDQSSVLTLAFVSRRLLAESVGIVFAVREVSDQLRQLPTLDVGALPDSDARALLTSGVHFRLDEQVCQRILAESRGNPLALLELPRGISATELAGIGNGPIPALSDGIEEGFRRRLEALPEETRLLLLIGAADPLGDPTIVWRAAARLGIRTDAGAPAEEAGLCEFGARIQFRHPLVRAAAYAAEPLGDRRRAHAAIAEVTDGEADPDRRAWHRALASPGPDDSVAEELERSAARARARGGDVAAAAFLARSVDLTLDPGSRADRALAAAEASHLAGRTEDALRLAAVTESGPLDELQRVRVDVLRTRVATIRRRPRDAPPLLLAAARRLESFDRETARDTYRDALVAAIFAGRLAGDHGLREVAAAVRRVGPLANPPSLTDALLNAVALLIDDGWASGAPAVQREIAGVLSTPTSATLGLRWLCLATTMAAWVWDDQTWDALSRRTIEELRNTASLALIAATAEVRVAIALFAGDITGAAGSVAEEDAIYAAIGGARSPISRAALAAFRGRESEVVRLQEATTRDAVARGDGATLTMLHWSAAVLYNGLGRYDEALAAAQLGSAYPADMHVSSWAVCELVEAAVRGGRPEAAGDALRRLAEMASACDTDWIVGVEARARALVADPADAEMLYCTAIERLGRTRMRSDFARALLLYGEWLRRQRRRIDARDQLSQAQQLFTSSGMDAFAARAGRELLATGATARKRTDQTREDLTAQEFQIAQLARDGLSNAEIGARLFISPRTVEYHLHKVFTKLGIASRERLDGVLPVSD